MRFCDGRRCSAVGFHPEPVTIGLLWDGGEPSGLK